MNSLPLISHRLFVAAISNEGQLPKRPTRYEKPPIEIPDPSAAVPLELLGQARPPSGGATYLARTPIPQPRD